MHFDNLYAFSPFIFFFSLIKSNRSILRVFAALAVLEHLRDLRARVAKRPPCVSVGSSFTENLTWAQTTLHPDTNAFN